ncbi:hypothetical protein DFH29DRAFT_782802, partial [Suillus ampliporus]
GQCTHMCPVYDLDHDKVVMFKDSWWVAITNILPEGETYKLLKKHNVSNVALCIACHNVPSIPQQALQTHKLAGAVWGYLHSLITPHIHYHLVLDLVGKQLCEFTSSHELITAICDTLIAHTDTYYNVGMLYQDISLGNIVIYDSKGIPINWDLSKL